MIENNTSTVSSIRVCCVGIIPDGQIMVKQQT